MVQLDWQKVLQAPQRVASKDPIISSVSSFGSVWISYLISEIPKIPSLREEHFF
jgi:hypothetical protein